MENIFKHNSRTYFDVYNALVAAYPNKPTWLFKEMGGLFDFQSELMNRIASDILYPKTRESAYAFADRCDYDPTESSGATATLTVTLTGAMAKTIAVGYQFSGLSSTTGLYNIFEVTAAASSGGTDTITCNVTQQKTNTSINIGVIDNQEDFMDYPIDGFNNIVASTISLTISALTWTKVANFDDSSASDRHFRLIYQSAGKVRIQFGDGTNGAKPALNSIIYATFAVTSGTLGRMAAADITVDEGNDPQILSVTNALATSGGSDSESVASIIRNSRANVRLRNAVWSIEDLETAALASSSSVIKALGIAGVGSAVIHAIPAGGASLGGALITEIDTYVTALTQFGIMPITVLDATTVTVNITATITVRSGFTAGTVEDLTEFALTLASSHFDSEIIEYYDDNGIDDCRTVKINTIWAWAFGEDENEALAFIIDKWKELLGARDYREWGQTMEVGDFWIMGNSLYDYGVDVFTLTAPTTNTAATSLQIIKTGTCAVTS